MTVAFSESDISSIHVGQAATVSIDALSGVELAAHVTTISPLATTSSSVVSYDATLTLDQTTPKVRAGMSASASVITGQAQGVTVPNQAITGSGSTGTVQVQENGKTVQQQVVVGVRGTSRSQIISGLHAGQQVVVTQTLPALGSTSSSSSSSTGTLGTGRSLFGSGGGFAGGGPPAGGFAGRGGG
ncbi:MAG TPA: HlyD family efflux transporter periplasmic adaptor subunit [Solirubrobacteraceae bacterium]|jgi:multidrug efflux pump subunit AcrA (membrane-fusion protein)|nr:HlyD family efflux transporter periplasmic adaptor subunit [Solirubrobacteraceae bacterium]